MTVTRELDALRRIRARLTPEGAWIQGHHARKTNGTPCSSQNVDACCWCLNGAAWAEDFDLGTLTDILRPFTGYSSTSLWNDRPDRTQAEVVAVLDKAIEVEAARRGEDGKIAECVIEP